MTRSRNATSDPLIVGLLAVALVFTAAVPAFADDFAAAAATRSAKAKVAEQLIGVTPALANTPFLGMATLCGLALLADSAWARQSNNAVVSSIRQNELVSRMRPYASGGLFAVLLAATLLAYVANSGKVQGVFGKLLHVVEAMIVLGAYIGLSATVLRDLPAAPVHTAQMGVFPAAASVLLGAATALALTAMMLVRLAAGVAVWLIPIPFVDVLFETVKKIVTLLIIVIYLVSPFLAAVLALGLILMSLVGVRWAWRLMSFVASIVVLPRLGLHRVESGEMRCSVPASVLAARGFGRREMAVLTIEGREVRVVSRRSARRPPLAVTASGNRLVLVRGFWWSELRETDGRGAVVSRVAFATAAFDALHDAAAPLGASVDESTLSAWLAVRPLRRELS